MQAPPAVEMAAVSVTSDDGSRWYTHPVTGRPLTSVTTILSGTEGKHFLTAWAARLAAEYAVDNLSTLQYLKKTKSREVAVNLAKAQARLLRERKADAGSHVHHVLEALIHYQMRSGQSAKAIQIPDLPEHLADADYDGIPLRDVVDHMIVGFTNFVSDWSPLFIAAEMPVYHPVLDVAGTLDTILFLPGVTLTLDGLLRTGKGVALVVDAKTGKNLDPTVQEQLAAYRRMPECLLNGRLQPLPETDGCALLHLRPEFPNGYRLMPVAPAADEEAWSRFKHAREVFFGREQLAKPGRIARPLKPDGTAPAPLLEDLRDDGYGRAPGALIKGGFNDLAEVAEWTGTDLRALKCGIGEKTLPEVERMLTEHGYSLAPETPVKAVA